jgi:hypothetical protein
LTDLTIFFSSLDCTATFVSLFFLVATTIYYSVNKKLRTTSGLSFLLFLVPFTVVFFSYEAFNLLGLYNFLIVGAVCEILTFLWASIMTFDIMWAIYTFRQPSESLGRFWVYCILVFLIASSLVVGFFYGNFSVLIWTIYILFISISFLNLVCIVVTVFKILSLSRSLNRMEHSRLKEETSK